MIVSNVSLAALTTLKIGGTGRWFVQVHSPEELESSYRWARDLPVLFLGQGSNVLFSDEGFPGLLIQNQIKGLDRQQDEVVVGGAENLGHLIRWVNQHRLKGLECMYGIPGSVAGAVIGNAGAYGQEIRDTVVNVQAWSPQGALVMTAEDAGFSYRHSVFKERRDHFILSCRLRLQPTSEDLQSISDEILTKRLLKYPAGLQCPGSFFKNIVAADLPPEILQTIPQDFIMFGKIPAGKLLEAVGAKGARRGDALIADYHANLIMNAGNAGSRDILSLADEYAGRVYEHFGIRLEPEILVVDSEDWPNISSHGLSGLHG
ncbi:MAG: UDP-N-acetylmuramate dehydrogenase [Acidobacteriota bacterium]